MRVRLMQRICLMDMEYLCAVLQMKSMKETGKNIREMEREEQFTRIKLSMRVVSSRIKSMELANTLGQMEMFMKENLIKTSYMVKEERLTLVSTSTMKVSSIKESKKQLRVMELMNSTVRSWNIQATILMAQELTSMLMENSIRASGKKTRWKATEKCTGVQMKSTRATGKTINAMVLASKLGLLEKNKNQLSLKRLKSYIRKLKKK